MDKFFPIIYVSDDIIVIVVTALIQIPEVTRQSTVTAIR